MEEVDKVYKLIIELNLNEIVKNDDLGIIKYKNPGPEFIKIKENDQVIVFRNLGTKSTKFFFLEEKPKPIIKTFEKHHFISPFE